MHCSRKGLWGDRLGNCRSLPGSRPERSARVAVAFSSGTKGGRIWERGSQENPQSSPVPPKGLAGPWRTFSLSKGQRCSSLIVMRRLGGKPSRRFSKQGEISHLTGEECRARIILPDGFEYKEAEMSNAVSLHVQSDDLAFQHTNCYAQLNEFVRLSAAELTGR